MNSTLERFFEADGPLADLLPGYRPRAVQQDFAQKAADILSKTSGRLVVEAGTGTGKSLAYLAAALLSDKKVLVSTATRALQDQLFHKDLPVVLKAIYAHTGKHKNAVLMKGRANYLCLLRAERHQPNLDLINPKTNEWIEAIRVWTSNTRTGDRTELSFLPEDSPLWGEFNARSDNCLGGECPLYGDCFVTNMRKNAEHADVVVVNHALFCAERTLQATSDGRAVQILPTTDAWIFDEAHALEDVATRHFGVSLSLHAMRFLSRDILKARDNFQGSNRMLLAAAADDMMAHFSYLFDQLAPLSQGDTRARVLELPLKSACQEALKELLEALRSAEVTVGICDVQDKIAKGNMQALARRLSQTSQQLNFMLDAKQQSAGYVAFIERDSTNGTLTAAPVDVASILEKSLWCTKNPVILTSATLAVKNDTQAFLRRVGLSGSTHTVESTIFPAPFDYPNRAGLYAPQAFSDPLQSNYMQRFCEEVEFLVEMSGGGAFLLFTSYRALQAAHDRLMPHFTQKGLLVLRQGDGPKLELLSQFVAADKQKGAVLMATHSFWEGVDVQGKALRLVVIDRLPFSVPDDPVYKARMQRLEAQGKSSFAELSLPEATLALKQGTGRLLRSIDDAGIVAILDGRLTQKSYGQVFIKSLPPFKQLHTRLQVLDFWNKQVLPTFHTKIITGEHHEQFV